MSNPRNINMKSSKLSNFHYIHVRLHIRCSPAQDRAKGTINNPKDKMLQYTPITEYTRYIAGVGSLKQQLERGPHYTTINVQESVTYNNPNKHCAPRTPTIRCAGLPKGTHITTVLPPIRERLHSDAQILVK